MFKIIIVEDDKEIREELKILLENSGHKVKLIEDFDNVADKIIKENAHLVDLMKTSSSELEKQTNDFFSAMSFFKTGVRRLEWSDNYNTNNSYIDEQHMNLINFINDIYSAIYEDDFERVKNIFNMTLDYTKYHFSDEEKFQKENSEKYRKIKEHFEQHRNFESLVAVKIKELDSVKDWKATASDMADILSKWLIQHIGVWDKEFVKTAGIYDK